MEKQITTKTRVLIVIVCSGDLKIFFIYFIYFIVKAQFHKTHFPSNW